MEEIDNLNWDNSVKVAVMKTARSLNNMLSEMLRKKLELKRITKVATLLKKTGFVSPHLFSMVEDKCVSTQASDGGWVSVVDTMWNVAFLSEINEEKYKTQINMGKKYLNVNQGVNKIWGRSKRDFERIPVSGTLMFLLPSLANSHRLRSLENLWISEKNSLTYKAAYTLMAFQKNAYTPNDKSIIINTIDWLIKNQREDGSFAPWRDHPVTSDVYCTSVALLGMLSYKELVPDYCLKRACQWILETQLPEGIWPFHEIDDGAGWALYAISSMFQFFRE